MSYMLAVALLVTTLLSTNLHAEQPLTRATIPGPYFILTHYQNFQYLQRVEGEPLTGCSVDVWQT